MIYFFRIKKAKKLGGKYKEFSIDEMTIKRATFVMQQCFTF